MTCAKYISCKLDFARHLNWGKPWEKLRTTWIMNTLGMFFSVTRYWFVYTMVLTFVVMKTSDKRRCTLCRWSRKFDLILSFDWFGQWRRSHQLNFETPIMYFIKCKSETKMAWNLFWTPWFMEKINKIRFTKSTRDLFIHRSAISAAAPAFSHVLHIFEVWCCCIASTVIFMCNDLLHPVHELHRIPFKSHSI